MPRRTTTSVGFHLPSPSVSRLPFVSNVELLRRQWKWAAFSQFFHIFRPIFSSSEVTLVDIEDDLSRSTNIFLPNLVQRLLYTLTLDRKISTENWQTILQKQYLKRAPGCNPFVLDQRPMPTESIVRAPQACDTGSAVLDGQLGNINNISSSPKGVATFATIDCEDAIDESGYKMQNGNQHAANESDYKNWCDFPMLVKLDTLYLLTEWQFQNPLRLRSIMKDDDEEARWRVEPIGKDAQNNSYWLMGGMILSGPVSFLVSYVVAPTNGCAGDVADRLWIQRALPDSRNISKKRRNVNRTSRSAKKPLPTRQCSPRLTKEPSEIIKPSPRISSVDPMLSKNTGRGTRLAKTRANMKLDSTRNEPQSQKQAIRDNYLKHGKLQEKRPMGTRVSARLRADIPKDGWQLVPEDWLTEDVTTIDPKSSLINSSHRDFDSMSDLTELSSDDQDSHCANSRSSVSETMLTPSVDSCSAPIQVDLGFEHPPTDFVEWETICLSRYDWEQITRRFENATHPSDVKLYKVLVNNVVPIVIDKLKEIERKQRLDEALVYRKRSSRIALKESEKEKAREAAKSQAEYEERINRARQLQARLHRAEAARESRVLTREQKRRERQDEELVYQGCYDVHPEEGSETLHSSCSSFHDRVELGMMRNGSASISRIPSPEVWELDCEICNQRAMNQDDGTPMMCCGICSRWQHILCHDKADSLAGRPKRNWKIEEFVCQRCRSEIINSRSDVASSRVSTDPVAFPHLPESVQHAVKLNLAVTQMSHNLFHPENITSKLANDREDWRNQFLASNGNEVPLLQSSLEYHDRDATTC